MFHKQIYVGMSCEYEHSVKKNAKTLTPTIAENLFTRMI